MQEKGGIMKAGELIDKLKNLGDFDIQISFWDKELEKQNPKWLPYRYLKIEGVADIGYSSKVVILSAEEE